MSTQTLCHPEGGSALFALTSRRTSITSMNLTPRHGPFDSRQNRPLPQGDTSERLFPRLVSHPTRRAESRRGGRPLRMSTWVSLLLLVVVQTCSLAIAQTGQAHESESAITKLTPVWVKSYPNLVPPSGQIRMVAVALSESGRCVSVAGNGFVEVLDVAGKLMWSWNYGAINRFITSGVLAISPACDSIALAGDSSYKYVWFADRRGRATPVYFTTTPLSVVFDHSGNLVAVGTGGCDILLFTKAGQLRWKTILNHGYGVVEPCHSRRTTGSL